MKLRRDSYNGTIGGVCEGIANYFNMSAGTVRLLAIISLFLSFGNAALVYILMWMFIPNQEY